MEGTVTSGVVSAVRLTEDGVKVIQTDAAANPGNSGGPLVSAAQLVGKLANIAPDLPSRQLQDTGSFKAITGGDDIQGERKFKPPFKFRPYARLLFGANQLPRSSDSTQAFFDRWVVIPFPNSFRGSGNEIHRTSYIPD